MISPCLSVCLCLSVITFETTSRFYDIQYRGHAIEDDLGAVMFNPVASTIPKWRTFKLLRGIQNLHQ
jgi:hypothetical protein